MYYILYSCHKVSWRKEENVNKKIIRKHIYCVSVYLLKKNCVSVPAQFKLMLCEAGVPSLWAMDWYFLSDQQQL